MKRILFALKKDWIAPVQERLDHRPFEASFRNFRQAPPFAFFHCIVLLYLNDYPALWRYRWGTEVLIPPEAVATRTDDKPRFTQFLRDNIAGKNSHVIAASGAR